jgi:Domain of unknown function (DUF6504)
VTRLWTEGEVVQAWGAAAAGGRPEGFTWQGTDHRIQEVCNRWRIHTRWWEPDQAVWREYVKVATDTGLLCLLYRDLLSGGWFLTREYD